MGFGGVVVDVGELVVVPVGEVGPGVEVDVPVVEELVDEELLQGTALQSG